MLLSIISSCCRCNCLYKSNTIMPKKGNKLYIKFVIRIVNKFVVVTIEPDVDTVVAVATFAV